ncbi:MAG TPA: M48 family metallopeptidase [Candidatus Nanoarchaeia archaeon]
MKTIVLMVAFTVFVLGITYVLTSALGYTESEAVGFTTIFLVIALIMNFASFYFSDSIILAISAARQIQKSDNPELFRLVENLCIAQGQPMPRIYIIDDTAPNAFATGRDPKHAAVAFTTGILQKLSRLELEGVVAHELSHIKNYDIRVMAVVTVLVGLIALVADMFFRMMWWGGGRRRDDRGGGGGILILIAVILALLSPLIAQLIRLAVSRRREFLADASGALLTRNPDSLATALVKISQDKEPLEVANKGTAHLYFENPFKDKQKGGVGWFAGLFNTHPSVEERVAALRAMQ